MARPERRNADYFPFYAKDGRTLHILEGKYKCKGTGFFTNVMRFLTLETDHHFNLQDESDYLYFFSKCHCDVESGVDMLNVMAKTGKICSELWIFHKVIISQDLLESLGDAYRNRKNPIITLNYIRDIYKNKVSCAGNDVTNEETPLNSVDKPQRKGKERKGKERKGENPSFLEINPDQQKRINELRKELQDKIFPKATHFINEMLCFGKNPETIILALERTLKKKNFDDTRGGVQAYCYKIVMVENGNINEAESREQHEVKKSDTKIHSKIKSVIGSIGERV